MLAYRRVPSEYGAFNGDLKKQNFGAAAAIYPCWLIRWGMILSYVIPFYPIYYI